MTSRILLRTATRLHPGQAGRPVRKVFEKPGSLLFSRGASRRGCARSQHVDAFAIRFTPSRLTLIPVIQIF
jgi:hypothetical protein